MLSQTEILLFVQNNKTYLHQQFGVNTIGLFGSFAIGKATEKSDIDFLVEFDNPKYLKPFIKNQILQSALYV
jgi:predicted nucleotidyltransferase